MGPGGGPDRAAATTSAQGLAYLVNPPAGEVTVDAALDGVSLREHAAPLRPLATAINTFVVGP